MDHLELAMVVKDRTVDDEASWIDNIYHMYEHTPPQTYVVEATSSAE
jgi:hypothetical protein